MTGYGVADRPWAGAWGPCTVHVEVRSVNARFLELKIRQPFGAATEHALRNRVQAALGRGRVDLSIHVQRGEEPAGGDALEALGVAPTRLSAVLDGLAEVDRRARERFELLPVNALEILKFAHTLGRAPASDPEVGPPEFLPALVDEAVAGLQQFRAREGLALTQALATEIDALGHAVASLRTQLTEDGRGLAQTLAARIDEFAGRLAAGGLDPERVRQEVAVVLLRADVTEELSRLSSHLTQARGVLAQPATSGQGKTLEFIAQELFREVTTIGSKIVSDAGGRLVIEAKSAIERMREQVLNVE
jgi:uncharacterized protein (TIGR00255 family)